MATADQKRVPTHARSRSGHLDPTRSTGRGLVHSLVTMGLVACIAAFALSVGHRNLEEATEERAAERAALVERFSLAGDRLYDARDTVELVADLPFVDGEDPTNLVLLDLFKLNPASDPYAGVAIVRADGTMVASRPAGLLLDQAVIGGALREALAGRPSLSPVFPLGADVAWARMVAVGGDRPWGALVFVEGLRDGWLQRLYQDLGSLGQGAGGLTLVDARGVAAASWNPDLLGEQVLDPLVVATAGGAPLQWTELVDGEPTFHVAVSRSGPHAGTALVFHQSEREFVGDLRRAQRHRDLVLLAMLVVSVLVLGAFTAHRQRSIRRAERRAEVVLAASDDVIAVVDEEGTLRSVSSGIERMLGHRPRDWSGRRLAELVAPEHRGRVAEALRRAVDVGQAATLGVSLVGNDGRSRWFDLTLIDRRDDDRVSGIVATCSEVEDRKTLEHALAHQANHDTLTGLANRAHFDSILAARLASDHEVVVGVVDLDRFKALNDQLGHDAGDDALRAVATILRTHVELVGAVGRLGGDEFVFWVERFSDQQLDALCRGLVTSIEAIWPGGASGPNLSASIGLSRARLGATTAEVLFREADRAMYEAKAAGGGQHRVATPRPDGEPQTPATERSPEPGSGRERTTTPVADGPAARSEPRPWNGQRRRDLLTLVLVVVMLVGFAAVTLGLADQAQRSSERDRLQDRVALIRSLAGTTASTTSPNRLMPLAAQIPWDPEAPEVTQFVLEQWILAPALGDNPVAAIVDLQGEVLSAAPPEVEVPPLATVDGAHWARVLDGTPWIPPLITSPDGRLRFFWVLPVVERGEVVRVMVLGASVRENNWSEVLAQVGSLGPFRGGAESIDANGVVISSWDASRIGEVAVEPALLAGLGPSDVLDARPVTDGGEHVVLVTALPDPHSERFMVWDQATADLFADLRQGEGTRDAALLGSVAVTIVGLGVTSRRRERALRLNNGRLHALLQRSSTIVAIVDRRGIITFVSSAAGSQTGYERRQLQGQPLDRLFGPLSGQVHAAIDDAVPGSEVRLRGVAIPDASNRPRVYDVGVVNLSGHTAVGGTLVTLRDRTDRQALEDSLRDQATHDPLTGLLNRAEFASAVEDADASARAEDASFAVVFVDLDRFKPVNDTYGHEVGDEVLRIVSKRLAAAVRAGDVVARHGGDEFTVLLRGCEADEAKVLTERLLDTIRQPIRVGNLEVQVGASAGVAVGAAGAGGIGHVLRTADQAMYQAKRAGRDRMTLDEVVHPV